MASFAPETGKSELLTFSGKVTFGQPGPNGTILNAVTVGAGQQSAVSAGKNPITPKAVPSADMKRLDKESKPETATPAANSPNSASGGGSDKKKSDSANSSGSTGSTSDSGSTTGDKKGGATAGTASGATTGTTTGANGSTGDSGDRSPASVGGAGGSGNGNGSGSTGGSMAGPGSGAGSGSGSGSMPGPMPGMVDHSDLGGGAVNTGLPGSIGNVKIPDVSAVAPVTQPTAVTLPKCDFCSQAVQNGSSKVNVIIHLPGK